MQRRLFSVTSIHSIGRTPGSGYTTSLRVHATSDIWLTMSAIARACDRLIVALCLALICPSTCVGIVANLHRLQIITLYSRQCINNWLNCPMANLEVGDFSFVLMASSYTHFTSTTKRFRVLIRLLLRHLDSRYSLIEETRSYILLYIEIYTKADHSVDSSVDRL